MIATGTCASSSALARATPSRLPTSSMWTGPTLVITPTSGSAIRASSSICPNPRMPISSTSTSVPSGAASTASGSPISVLKLAGLAATRRCGAISAAISCLVEVLPTEPVTPITAASSARRQAVASVCSASSGSSATSTAPPESPSACCRIDEHAPRARRQRVGGEPAAVHALAAQADEQVARLDRARVDDGARRPARTAARRAARRPLRRPARHPRRSRAGTCAAIASRATAESSNGSLRPFSNSWPCSCPLPAITTTSPGSASAIAWKIVARRSASRSTAACGRAGMPATISSMIASGASERGLSDVISATSASRAAISPMIGRLPRSRSPPGADHDDQLARRPARARRAAPARARRACARSRRRRRTAAPPRPAGSGPGAVAANASESGIVSAGAPSARAAAQAASAFKTLKRPGIGTRAGNAPSGVTAMKSQPVRVRAHVDRAVVGLALDRERQAVELLDQPPAVRHRRR